MYSGQQVIDPNQDPIRQQVMQRLRQQPPSVGIPSPGGTTPAPQTFAPTQPSSSVSPYGDVPPPSAPPPVARTLDAAVPRQPPTTPTMPTPAAPGGVNSGGPVHETPVTPTTGGTAADPYASTKLRFKTANDYLQSVLSSGQVQNLGGIQSVVDLANKIYGLQSGSGAQYYAPGSHGPGSQEVIGLPGGYFAHANNDPNGAWQWVASNEVAGGNAAQTSTVSPFLQQIRDTLIQRIQRDNAPVDPNSPEIAAPFNAAQQASDRSLAQEQKANAEAAFASSGGGSIDRNALDMQRQQATERSGTALATLRSTLVANAYKAQRADLDSAMQQALASGDAEMARQVQLKISELNAQIQREGLGVQLAINTSNQNAGTTIAAGGR